MSSANGNPNHVDHLRTGAVLVRTYHARPESPGPGGTDEIAAPFSSIVLPCQGSFVKHTTGRAILADANRAVFFRRGEVYSTSHPAGASRLILEIGFPGEPPREIADELDPHAARRQDGMRTHAFTDDRVCMARHLLVRRLGKLNREDRVSTDPLALEEYALRIARHTLDERPASPSRARRPATARAHDELAEATAAYLAQNYAERIELADISDAVHASPYHLARIFAAESGWTIHRYLTNLRLRAALERLADSHVDLTRVALDSGFCSHSHFTRSFRAAFGVTPSRVRAPDADALRSAMMGLGRRAD